MKEPHESAPSTEPSHLIASDEKDHAINRRVNRLARIALAAMVLTAASTSETVDVYGELAAKNVTTFMRQANPLDSEPDPTTFDSLEYKFGAGNGLYTNGEYGNYTSIWPHSGAIEAYWTAQLSDPNSDEYKNRYYRALDASNYYWDNGSHDGMPGYEAHIQAPLANKSERFVDDNLWLGLILAREYKHSGDGEALQKAENIFALAIDQWDFERGGIYWQVQRSHAKDNTRAIVSNAPAVQLGVTLYEITGQENYLTQSERIFEWINELEDLNENLYNDHMRIDGSHESSKWTYGQGVVAGAIASLHTVDPEQYPLEDAVELAERTLDAYQSGRIMVSPEFDAILFHNLLWIAWLHQDPNFTDRVEAVLASAVNKLPESYDDLLPTVGSLRLRSLERMPDESYGRLF